MEVIQSFTIDHTYLKPGIYVSRTDKGFTTFDLRITEPNKYGITGDGDHRGRFFASEATCGRALLITY